jgi:hypothetical protein
MQFAVFGNHDLPALAVVPVEYAQHFVHRWIWIAPHGPIFNRKNYQAIARHAAQLFRHIDKMPGTTIERAHDVEVPIVILISSLGIQNQVYVCVLREAKLLNIPVPVLNADKEFFDVTAGGIRAEGLVGYIEAQNAVVHERSYLRSDINAAVARTKLGGDQFAALRRREAG